MSYTQKAAKIVAFFFDASAARAVVRTSQLDNADKTSFLHILYK